MPEKERISLYVMPELKDWLKDESERTGKTINALIVQMIESKKARAKWAMSKEKKYKDWLKALADKLAIRWMNDE